MRKHRLIQTLALAFVIALVGARAAVPVAGRQAATLADKIVLTPPERVGFSGDSLKELDAAMQGIVDKKHLAGIGPVHIQPGLGFGYDFAVMSDPAALKSPLGKGS